MNVPASITLLEFNNRIKQLLVHASVQRCWVLAELSDFSVKGGHCYMELIQKDDSSGRILAKNRGIIWANVYNKLRFDFESVTGQRLMSGLKLLVEVSVNYHEQFGMSLIITNINPEYTLGDMARQRKEIIDRLTREGIVGMNRELPWTEVPQRIAVISAPDAAGYGDFMNQLRNNETGLQFYTCLFTATMQGVNTVPTVLAAFDRINSHIELFDCVVVIRGGGATSELHSFDNYDLAATIAQFPIPVITGIGHERDVTVLDYVAAMRVKTPTAAAEWLIDRNETALAQIQNLSDAVASTAREYLSQANEQLSYYSGTIPLVIKNIVDTSKVKLMQYMQTVPMCARNRINDAGSTLKHIRQTLGQAASQRIMREKLLLKAIYDKVEILSPANTLKRGYSLTVCNGRAVTDVSQVKRGDEVVTHLAVGKITSIVK